LSSALVATYAQFPFTLMDGRGSRVRDSQGREYWDLYGGHAVTVIGHSHPGVARAMHEQAQRLAFYSNVVPLDVRTRAAEALAAFAPPGLEHVFFCNSGTEANENALKIALMQTGRTRLAGVRGGWHGRSILALSVTTDDKLTRPFESLLCDSVKVPPNDVSGLAQIDERVAAVILEPVQSMAGVVEMSGEFLRALRRRCDAAGALLIYDEVQTGVGRLGRPLAAGEHGVLPDMVTMAKGLANGIPIGAVVMTPAVAGRLRTGDLGTTFGGGPMPCAALLATLGEIERGGLVEQAAEFGRQAKARLRVGPVREVLGRGCLIGLRMADAKVAQRQLFELGFITGTSVDPGVLRLLPAINTPSEALEQLAAALARLGEPINAALA
jgi:acetylornithine/N-succinyldiaminopimelate aminotransferase